VRFRQDESDDVREESASLAMSLAVDQCSDDRPPAAPTHPDDTSGAEPPGARLREQREQRGLTLDDLARATKISKTVLRALEATDVPHLPAAIYTRGFLKAYAREVGLPPDATADEYLRAVEPHSGQRSEDTGDRPQHVASPARAAHDDLQRVRAEKQTSVVGWLLTGAALVGLIVYVMSFSRAARQGPDARAAVVPDVAQDAAHASADHTTAVAESAAPAGGVANVALGDRVLRLELVIHAQCWVSARVDGEPVLAKLLQPGERHTLEVSDEAVLRVGEPGALSFSINGQSGRSLGRAGEPVTVRITKDNFRGFLSS
jgi:cytoskeletal protein RodZ